MSQNIVSLDHASVSGRIGSLHRVLQDGGLPWAAFQQPINDPALRQRLIRNWLAGVPEVALPYGETPAKRALEIVQTSYGPDLVTRCLGWEYDAGQRRMLESVPLPEDLLVRHADTHILVPKHPAATILSLQGVKIVRKKSFFANQDWYVKQALASLSCGMGWLFLRKGAVHGTFNFPRSSQIQHLLFGERIPYCIEVTYATILHKLVVYEWMFSKCLRCQDFSFDGHSLDVGVDEGRLVFCSRLVDASVLDVGLASVWSS